MSCKYHENGKHQMKIAYEDKRCPKCYMTRRQVWSCLCGKTDRKTMPCECKR